MKIFHRSLLYNQYYIEGRYLIAASHFLINMKYINLVLLYFDLDFAFNQVDEVARVTFEDKWAPVTTDTDILYQRVCY